MRRTTYFCTLSLLIAAATGCHFAAAAIKPDNSSRVAAEVLNTNTTVSAVSASAAAVSSDDQGSAAAESTATATTAASIPGSSLSQAEVYKAYSDILAQNANDINKAEKFNILELRGMPIHIGDLTGDGNLELAFLTSYADAIATGETLHIYSCDDGYVRLIYEENFGGGIDHREYKVLFQTTDNSLYIASFMEGAYGEDTESYYKLLPDEEGFYEESSDGIQRTHTDSVSYSYTEGYTAETFETAANDIVASAQTVILCNMASNSSLEERSVHLVSMAVTSGAVGYSDAQTILGGDPELPYIDSDSEYILPNSDRRYLSESDIASLTSEQLRLARNEIYARYNCSFSDETLREYFNQFSWYDGFGWRSAKDLPVSSMNEYEQYNLNLILAREEELSSASAAATVGMAEGDSNAAQSTSPTPGNPEGDGNAPQSEPAAGNPEGDAGADTANAYIATNAEGETFPANAFQWMVEESTGKKNPYLYIVEHGYGEHSEGNRDIYILDAGDLTVMDATIGTYDLIYNDGGFALSIWKSPNGLCAISSFFKLRNNVTYDEDGNRNNNYSPGGDYITDENKVRSILQGYNIPEDYVPYNSLEQ